MALGGGSFLIQNKTLPGSYINFVSRQRATATLSDRGYAAMPLLQVNIPKIKGKCFISVYARRGNNEGEKNSIGLYKFVLNEKNGGVEQLKSKAFGTDDIFISASFEITEAGTYYIGGEAGGICIANAQLEMYDYNVSTYFNGEKVEELKGEKIEELESEYVDFKTGAALSVNNGLEMSGGTDGVASALKYQQALTELESYSFNTLGCISTDETVKKLFAEYTKRLRDECGVKFQCVLHNYEADYEGVINVVNTASDGVWGNELVYWVTGASAGCMVNKSITNSKYTGEYSPVCNYSQSELTECIKDGMLVFHKVNDEIRILKDINSLVSITDEKNNDFCLNQVIRVLDQIGNDVAVIFNDKYCGKVSNDNAGRTSLWNDIVKLCNQLESIRAIEDFNDDNCLVQAGENKTSVVVNLDVTPTCAMDTLYMTVYVS